jgi:hypothetical protein
MAKLHTHYITNAQRELKHAYIGVPEDVFHSSIQEALSNAKAHDDLDEDEDDFYDYDDSDSGDSDFYDDDGDDDKEDEEDEEDDSKKNTEIERWVNINDSELKKLLNIEVNVVIEPHPVIDHGSNVFDIEAAVDRALGE